MAKVKEDIYYIPTKEDYYRDPDYYGKHFGRKRSPLSTDAMPTEPIKQSTLGKEVLTHLERFDNVISDDIIAQIESFAKLFNYCIEMNQSTKSNSRLVYAAQTGTAKSLSLKTYVSLLEEHSSLIVVSKVDEALEYCSFINELRDDGSYARCYYSVTDKNKRSDLRVEKEELKNYQCIVISHAMFKNVNQSESIDIYKLYKDKQRDLVVIDERLNLYDTVKVSRKELESVLSILLKYVSDLELDKEESLGVLELILEILNVHREVDIHDTKNNYIDFNDEYLEYLHKEFPDIDKEFDKIVALANAKLDTIKDELYSLGAIRSDSVINTALNNITDLINTLRILFKDDMLTEHTTHYYKSNNEESLFQVHDIANKLGTSVVLDATASINEFYKVAYQYDSSIHEVYAKPIRVYSNLSLYKAKGFRQGRSSIYKRLPAKDVEHNAQMYLSYALNTLNSPKDKMLIVCHKGFKLSLQKICNDSKIRFTHWGDHIGKNNWSDCNIVMIIGWNLLPQKEHIFHLFNAIRNEDISAYAADKDLLNNFKTTQLADDLIQGIMRSHARKIATKDGDCKKTRVYLFYEDLKEYNDVLDIVISEFPKCNVIEWTPIGIVKKVKQTKQNKNADLVISYLQEKESQYKDIMLKRVIQELELKSYTMSRIISSEYFLQELDKKGYKLKNSDGKSKYFILK